MCVCVRAASDRVSASCACTCSSYPFGPDTEVVALWSEVSLINISNMRKSLWSPDEDEKLRQYVAKHGCGNWSDVAKHTGLHRCGKSCRLRWINYLRPDLKRGPFTAHEVRLVVNLHNNLGNSWSKIAARLSGRTDNDVKNFWHSYTRSRRIQQQQWMDTGLAHDTESYIYANEEKPCCDSNLYSTQTISGVKKKSREEEHGYTDHHRELQQLPLMFSSTNKINEMAVLDCKAVPSINVDNYAPPFQFGIGNHMQLALPNTNIPITNKSHTSHIPPSDPHLPATSYIKTTAFNPIMIGQNHLQNASESATASIYKGIQTPAQIRGSKLGSLLYASSFDHSTSSLQASASCSAVSSMSHIDSQKSLDLQMYNAADHEWSSLMFSPSTPINYSTSPLHCLADIISASSFDQAANSNIDSKPPDGLQSVIWRFLNQQDADHLAAAASYCTPDQHRAGHSHHHFPYNTFQKSNPVAINTFTLGSETNIQPPIQVPSLADQLLNVEEAF